MAATYTAFPIAATIVPLKDALNAKGLITTVLYEDADCLIFSTPLTTKVIKIKAPQANDQFNVHYGDAWTSAETITNSVTFANRNTGAVLDFAIIADTTWFLLSWHSSGAAPHYHAYVGALSNGDPIVFGFCNSMYSSWASNNRAINLATGHDMLPIGIKSYRTFSDASGYLLETPLIWQDYVTNQIIYNGAAPAETLGVTVSSFMPGEAHELGVDYMLTPGVAFGHFGGAYIQTLWSSLLIKFTP